MWFLNDGRFGVLIDPVARVGLGDIDHGAEEDLEALGKLRSMIDNFSTIAQVGR